MECPLCSALIAFFRFYGRDDLIEKINHLTQNAETVPDLVEQVADMIQSFSEDKAAVEKILDGGVWIFDMRDPGEEGGVACIKKPS